MYRKPEPLIDNSESIYNLANQRKDSFEDIGIQLQPHRLRKKEDNSPKPFKSGLLKTNAAGEK